MTGTDRKKPRRNVRKISGDLSVIPAAQLQAEAARSRAWSGDGTA